jgi:hypothetical protein
MTQRVEYRITVDGLIEVKGTGNPEEALNYFSRYQGQGKKVTLTITVYNDVEGSHE